MIVALARKVCPSAKSAHGHGWAAAAMMLPSLSTKIVPAASIVADGLRWIGHDTCGISHAKKQGMHP